MLQDRVAGILWGLAAGDKNGGPIRMAVLLAESLATTRVSIDAEDACADPPNCAGDAKTCAVDAGDSAGDGKCGVEVSAKKKRRVRQFVRSSVVSRYEAWYQGLDSEPCFDTGNTFSSVFSSMKRKGLTNEEAVLEEFKKSPINAGINSAHRAAPIAMAKFINDNDILRITKDESSITHFNSISIQVAQIVTTILRALIRGDTWEESVQKAKHIDGLSEDVKKAFDEPKDVSKLSKGGYAPKVLEAALYFVGQNPEPDKAIANSLKFAGADNFCPVLVGAFCGARAGRNEFLKCARTELQETSMKMQKRIEKVVNQLSDMWAPDYKSDEDED